MGERQADVAPNGARTADRRTGVGDRRKGGDRRNAGTETPDDAPCATGADIKVLKPRLNEEDSGAETLRVDPEQDGPEGREGVTTVLDVSRERRLASLTWQAEGRRATEIAVLIPCRNEEPTIAKVVTDFRRALPAAKVYVYDNASTDHSVEAALEAGAIVRRVPAVGKGNVVRRMFAEIDADVYLLADGDDTYDAEAAPQFVQRLVDGNFDMVVGARVVSSAEAAYPRGHRLGNRLLTGSIHWLFRNGGGADVLSGYRAFSRRYAKSFPAVSGGFETEAEMTVHALELSLPIEEIRTDYHSRPTDSASKLRAIPDGLRILKFILHLWKDYRPLSFFGSIASILVLAAVSVALLAGGRLHAWTPATFTFAGLMSFACIAFLAGVVLDSVGRTQREVKRMLYLAVPEGGVTRVSGLLT
jgi:hypothetical protein